jgi:MYXO-CTERM domain-containing protein
MGNKKITKSGVNTSLRHSSRTLFAWYVQAGVALMAVAILGAAPVGLAQAEYYGDVTPIFTATDCSDCHGTGGACDGSGNQTAWMGSYSSVAECAGTISSRVSNDEMPQGCSPTGTYRCLTTGEKATISNWYNDGAPQAAPPAPINLSVVTKSKTTATLRGTFNPNVISGTLVGGTYRFEWGPDTGLGFFTGTGSVTGTSGSTQTTVLSNLECGNVYFYRAQVRNGGNATYTNATTTLSFSTDDCTDPEITLDTGADPVLVAEDSLAGDFPLTLEAMDDDPGVLTWSISSVASNGTAGASGTGNTKAITYAPNANYNGVDQFTVQVTNGTTGRSGEYVVDVTIVEVTDPPIITEGDDPLDLTATVEDTATMHTLNATDADSDPISWSVVSGPNHGMVTFPAGDANFKVFTYTPGQDATTTGTYTVRATSLTENDEIVINVPIIPVNDSPIIDPVAGQAATEGLLLTVTPTLYDPDDPNDGSGALSWSITSPADFAALGMSISNVGVFSWTPTLGTAPTPGVFNDLHSVTIRVQDDTGGSTPDTETFSVTVNPPDADADMVADYNDFCPGATPSATSTDSTNADNDGDGTRGSDADPNDSVGGDVCDTDDDNDGMPDSFEDANSLDKFDPSDAAGDVDGDGVSNLQEYIDGTSPSQVNLVIDATGYLTPYVLSIPEPTSIHSLATTLTPMLATPAVSSSATGPYRPGNNTILWIPSNGSDDDLATSDPANLITDPPTQPFFIRPLASLDVDQQVEENSVVTVTVRLNGDSPSWSVTAPALPTDATVNYTVSGTANFPADHTAVAGVLNFGVGDYEQDISFNVLLDGEIDPDETIVFTLTDGNNVAIGSNNTHTVIIVEGNIAPRAQLQFNQGGFTVGSAYEGSAITVDAMPSDANSAQTLSCDWTGTDNALTPPGIVNDCVADPDWDITVPVAGNYLVDVVVTDNGSPANSTQVSRILHVSAGAAVTLVSTDDSDLDGVDDLLEGFADADGDGIPAYLDAIDGTVAGGNLIPDQTVDPGASLLLETEPGLTLRRGSTTQAANLYGALVTDSDVEAFGSIRGDAPLNGADNFEHVGGVYDFQIDGLIPGSSARIVIPLQSAIPQDAHYRKFNPATGWSDFVVDANNLIASASGELGACPEPGSSAYINGLNYLDNCIQLTIQDGGPNDTDNRVNGVINDPATVGLTITEPEGFEEVEEGSGGRVSPLLLAVLLMLGVIAFWRRRRRAGFDY